MAELHLIGQIISGSGFPDNRLLCRWGLHCGGGWRVIQGEKEGQTHTDLGLAEQSAFFCHPIDLHLATRTIQGWPKVHLTVHHHDDWGRQEIYGYGFCHVPTQPGEHDIECLIWRPAGSYREEVVQSFVGGGRQLRSADIVHSGLDRYRLVTTSMGQIQLRLGVILRNFDKFGVEC